MDIPNKNKKLSEKIKNQTQEFLSSGGHIDVDQYDEQKIKKELSGKYQEQLRKLKNRRSK